MSDGEDEDRSVSLEWRDYVALVVASLETVLLPLMLAILIMIAIYIVIR
jgi:hypothetical protein